MERSPERYLLYFILIGSLGSMMLLYGITAYPEQRKIAAGALAIASMLIVLGIGILVQKVRKK